MLTYQLLTTQQQTLLDRYQHQPQFQTLLSQKHAHEIPHYLNYLLLVEQALPKKEDPAKKMQAFFKKTLSQQEKNTQQATAIRQAFQKKNKWSAVLKDLTTPDDLQAIDQLCQTLAAHAHDADAMLRTFFEQLKTAKSALRKNKVQPDQSLEAALNELPPNWYAEPWYYCYVQYFGTDEKNKGTFKTLLLMLDYLEELGIKNLYLLPHYESPNGDAGYDISDYRPAKALGGMRQFKTFIKAANQRGFRIATDLVFNHTSVEHPWFLDALNGDPTCFNYYLKCPDHWSKLPLEKILQDEDGDFFLYLPEVNAEGKEVISKRILIFPDVDKTLWLEKSVKGLTNPILFYREFYPFQVDLDMQNPLVFEELLKFLGEEISLGVLGKRTDAIAHWVKQPGTNAKDLPETYALQMLVKQFLKHLHPRTIILPEVVTDSRTLKGYAGEATTINGEITTTGGDALLDFQLQGMLREMLYFQKTTPFWTQVFDRGLEGTNTAVPLLPIEHHDETYMGFFKELEPMRHYIDGYYQYHDGQNHLQNLRRGIIYKNGMSGGARYADCLNQDQRRIALAFFTLYLMPATPVIYYGTEIGATNQWQQMEIRQQAQFDTLLHLLGPELVGPNKPITFEKCLDPRELQRGPIASTSFFEALEQPYPAQQMIRLLNQLRQQEPALRSFDLSPLDTYNASILGMIRYPAENQMGSPLVAFANLSERPLRAQVPGFQLMQKLNVEELHFRELLRLEGSSPQEAVVKFTETELVLPKVPLIDFPLLPYSAVLWAPIRPMVGSTPGHNPDSAFERSR